MTISLKQLEDVQKMAKEDANTNVQGGKGSMGALALSWLWSNLIQPAYTSLRWGAGFTLN